MPWVARAEDELVGVGRFVRVQHVGDVTVVFVCGAPVRRLARADIAALRVELASFVLMDIVSQADVMRSGLVAEATFHRDCQAFRSGGEQAVRSRMGAGPRLVPDALAEIKRLFESNASIWRIAAQLGMNRVTVRSGLRRLGLHRDAASAEQLSSAPRTEPAVDNTIEAAEIVGATGVAAETGVESTDEVAAIDAVIASDAVSTDDTAKKIAAQRATELTLGRMGLLSEQSALFPPSPHVPRAGVLLALSLLSMTGLLDEVRQRLPVLPNGLYGARSIVTTLVAMALLRCRRAEQLKGFDPTTLGAVVGLARAPEMKTLRDKHRLLAADEERVKTLVRAMAKRHVERAKDAIAFLYVDGHVRPYFGDKELTKAHHTAMRISLPATTDYWVNDATGAPVLVVVTEGNLAMTKSMPALLDDVRSVVGAQARPTVVFDRGGYSAKLFTLIIARKFDFITYRKGKHRKVARKMFTKLTIRRGGRDRQTLVHDGRVHVKGFGRIRCVAVLRPDGKQTHVLTSRTDLTAREILERMFSRWQQENFFKYLDEQYAFDALWTYSAVAGDPNRSVPNPLRKKLDRIIREQRTEVRRRTAKLGDVARAARPLDPDTKRAELEAQLAAAREIAEIDAKLATLRKRRKSLPKRVPIGSLREHDVVELARAPMLLGDVIKMTAFHIETMLVALVSPHLKRANDEARAVIADFMQLHGAFDVRGDQLHIALHPPSAPRYERALRAVCDHLNAQSPTFPETKTTLHFTVATPKTG